MDASLYMAINGLAGHVAPIDDFFAFLAANGPFLMVGLVALLWFWPGARAVRDRRQWGAVVAALSAAIALGINQIIIRIWVRPRPFVGHPHTLLLPPSHDPSFPSDHATGAFAIAVAILLVARRAGLFALLLAALIAFARVYTGEHYVSDVVVGAVIGTVTALALFRTQPLLSVILEPPMRLARRVHLA